MLAILPLLLFAQQPAAPPKTHNVAVDNEHVKVIHAMNVPGQKSRMHKHDVNRVMVHLDSGTMRIAHQDGRVDDIPFQPGQVRWDPAGGLHTSENIGGSSFHIVEIEIKKHVTAAAGAKPGVDIDNAQVRVTRRRIAPGQKTKMPSPGLSVILLPGAKAISTWGDPVVPEGIAKPLDVVLVEVKSAAR